MKTKTTLVAGLVVLLSTVFFASNAQTTTTPAVKVLPTTKEGIVKLLVVGSTDEAVDVKFYNEDGFVESDAVKTGEEGFNKKYDVRNIMNRGFVMEVTAAGTSVTYKLAKSNGKLTPYLARAMYTYPLVASND